MTLQSLHRHTCRGLRRAESVALGAILSIVSLLSAPTIASPTIASPTRDPAATDPSAETRLLRGTRQVTFEGRRAGESYFNADGTKMVFQSEREEGNPFYQIYLLDLETGDVERVSPGHGKTTCAWIHPNDSKVLYASTHADPEARNKQKDELELRASGKERRYAWDYDEHFDLYETHLASGQHRNLTQALGYDAEASWSPDGALIAFSSNRHAYETPLSIEDGERLQIDKSYFLDIYLMNADGSGVRRLTRTPGYDGGPFFSPTGDRICWRRFSPDGATAEVYTMALDGTDVTQLTQLGAMSWAPFYHPSGEYLIFTTNRHGFSNFELYLVDVSGAKEPQRVTFTPGFDGLPVFHPDGSQLYWTSNRTPKKQSQVFAARWDHSGARKLLEEAPPRKKHDPVAPHPSRHPSESQESLGKSSKASRAHVDAVTDAAIREEDLRAHVARLADEEMEGRLTGTVGEELATEYVARWFERFGLKPGGDAESYFQPFTFTAGIALGKTNRLELRTNTADEVIHLAVEQDWVPLAFSQVGEFKPSGVVFAGYGIVAPQDDGQAEYDAYVHLDVKDKWVIVLRYMPEGISQERRQHLSRYAAVRYKAMVARDKGAHGLIVVSGPSSQVKNQLVKLGFDASLAGTSLPAISMTDAAVEPLFASSKTSLAELQQTLDTGKPQMGLQLAGVSIGGVIDLEKVRKTGRNVIGRLPAGETAAAQPAVIIGAHVDHLGRGSNGSLAHENESGEIHYGADDNASGVAAVLEAAEYLAAQQRAGRLALKRDILFAAWSGEELGLLGSKHYVEAVTETLGKPEHLRGALAACLNLDMVGRLDGALVLNGVGSSSIWRREIERRNVVVGLPLKLSDDSYLPTDATSFYLKGVPILSAFTGSHSEYHTPRDTADKLNYPDMERVARFMTLVLRGLAVAETAPDYIAVQRPKEQRVRAGLRVYLGTIPDYAESPIKGLKLSGVARGGPAEKAGLKSGDVIVELAGRKVENIYDYTYAIDALKVDKSATVVVVRGEKRLKLQIVPSSRD